MYGSKFFLYSFIAAAYLSPLQAGVEIENLPETANVVKVSQAANTSSDSGPVSETTPTQILNACGYVAGHISNMICIAKPGREGTFQEAQKRWNPIVRLIPGPVIREAYLEKKRRELESYYGPNVNVEDFLKKQFMSWNRTEKDEELQNKFDAFMDELFSERYFGVSDFATTPAMSFLSQELIESIFRGAREMLALSKQGDTLVCFGNTPYYVGRALHQLVSDDPSDPHFRSVVIFPFSGSPNKIRPGSFPTPEDDVTEERLQHLQQRLKTADLTAQNEQLQSHQTFFIDVVGSGAGPAYVIEEILREFAQRELPTPDLNVITMNKIDICGEDERNLTIALDNADKDGKLTFCFPSIEDPHFFIDAFEVYVHGHGALDNLSYKEMRVLPEYNPCYWHSQYDHLLKDDYFAKENFPQHIQVMFDYFDFHIARLKLVE